MSYQSEYEQTLINMKQMVADVEAWKHVKLR